MAPCLLLRCQSVRGTESLGGVPLIRMDSWPPVSPMPSKADVAHLQPCNPFGRSWFGLAVGCILKFVVYPANIYGVPTEQAEGGLPVGSGRRPGLYLHTSFCFSSHSGLSAAGGGEGWGRVGTLGG